ncbi:PHP domain-containing protein [Thermaerobacter subterraneus]|uniref:Metal-dependent phosphoesterase, PHP family n=1 Tax=Thermaerobacter subterraneus DSM 13965 TaxID=867903 RepID=K6NYH7_9FIRM|nr:PHP domain-containing protein [Thermaerobacter subterraneus]EKP93935.1 putative metal-dependent phosphoesterase, PHP family [Thermaerobacter subterraneus DSM 13965]
MTAERGGADLHTHTTASDGTVTPRERIRMAREAELEFVGITDHDTLAGLPAAREAAREAGVVLVPGVELSTDVDLGSRRVGVHILGYWVDEAAEPLVQLLARRRASREQRLARMLQRLAEAGIVLDEERIRAMAQGGAIGRPHVARALVEAGVVATVAEAFERYLTPGKPGYVPRAPLAPEEAIAAIRAAGGVPVLAHPGLLPSRLQGLWPAWKRMGLAGVEVYHSKHSPGQAADFLARARELDLVPTGGSDCHGPQPGQPALMGRVRVPREWVERLAARAADPEHTL